MEITPKSWKSLQNHGVQNRIGPAQTGPELEFPSTELQNWILRPPTEPSRRPPPAAPSCLMSPIKMAEKAAAATSIAKWLCQTCSLSGKKRRGWRRSTPGMAGHSIKSAFLAPGAGMSQESMQKPPFTTPPLAPPRRRDASSEAASPINKLRSDKPRTGVPWRGKVTQTGFGKRGF